MAKQPTSAQQDPAVLAFSAVEDALRDSVFTSQDASGRKPGKNDKSGEKPSASKSDRARASEKIAAQTSGFANDDRFTTSRLLFGLQSKASPVPLIIAFALSVAWVAIASLAGWQRYGATLGDSAQATEFYGSLEFVALLAITFVPVLGFFGIAILMRRAQDLRLAATSMTQAAMRLTEPEAAAADRVASVGQAVRREVNALGDGLERALSRAGELEVMVHNEVTALERTYSDNEARLRLLINELSEQRNAVITNSDRVREAIGEAHSLMISDIDRIGESLSGTILERGESVRKSIESVTGEFDSTFDRRSSEFVQQIENRTTDMVSALEDGTNRATSAIDGHTSSVSEAISSSSESMIARLEERGHAMSGALEAIGQRLVGDISDRTKQSEDALGTITSRLDETLSIRVNAIESRFQTALLEIGGLMEDGTETARKTIAGAGSENLAALSARVDEVSVVLDNRIKVMDAVVGDKGENLIQVLDGHAAEFTNRANLLESALAEKTDTLSAAVEARTAELGATLETRTTDLNTAFETRTAELGAAIEAGKTGLSTALDSRTTELNAALDSRTSDLNAALEARTAELGAAMDTSTREFAETIATRTQQLSDAIATRTARFSETLSNETEHLATTVDTRVTTLSETLSARSSEMSQQIDGHSQAIEKRLNTVVQTVNAAMIGQVNSLSELVSTKITEVNANIGTEIDTAISRLNDAETGVTARLDSATSKISDSARNAAETVEFGIEHARSSITEMVDKRLGTLPEAITARAEIAADRLGELNESMTGAIGKSMAELEQGADRIEQTISERISQATASIAADVEQSTARMDVAVRSALEQVKQAAHHIEELVDVRAVNTADSLSAKVAEMNRAVSEQSETFANIIDSKTAQLDASLRDHGNLLHQALEASSAESERLVASSTGRMLDNVEDALRKLDDSNHMLQRVLETTTGNLARIETDVAGHASSYASTVKEALGATEEAGRLVGNNVGAFQASITSMVEQFGTLLSQLENKSESIDNAAHSLQEAGNFSIDTLENRRGAMEALAESFTARADDIDERMRAFAQSISDTMGDTESRLAAARQAMENSLAATGEAVREQLGTFTQSADAQGEQAAEAFKKAQQAMLAEVETALAEATRRFGDTAEAMRSTAGQVSQELEATRTELQRGVIELPEETRASAAAMRRVVAEQIEALNELNNIVRSQSSTHDASARRAIATRAPAPAPRQVESPREPVESRPASNHREPIEPRRPSSSLADEDDRFTMPVETRDAAPQRGSFGTQTVAEPQERNYETVRPQQAPRTARPPQPVATSEGSGWLRDVLRNASASQQASGQQRGASLTDLTGEIARSIEPNAHAEAWQRYQAGEPNVFSRRIYTLSGQGTYDEVRKKLQRDPEFANTASAYMDEFEQVLHQAARGRNPSTETRDLLLSERGKVYTMLAHANGRLN